MSTIDEQEAPDRQEVNDAWRRLLHHVDTGPYSIEGGWGSAVPRAKRVHIRLVLSVLSSLVPGDLEPGLWLQSATVVRHGAGKALREDLTAPLAGWAHGVPSQARQDVLTLLDALDYETQLRTAR